MEYHLKLKLAHEEARSNRIWECNYNPPVFRLICRLGAKVPPPYYQGFYFSFIWCFCYFTPIYALSLYAFTQQEFYEVINTVFISGLFFSFFMSLFYKVRRAQFKLTKWSSLEQDKVIKSDS